jgi:hypothetical protein
MTADLPCLKNVRLVLETIGHLGYSEDKVKLILNRSNAFTGINVKNAESALKRRIDYQIMNEYRCHRRPEQRRAVHVHEVGLVAGQEHARLREGHGEGPGLTCVAGGGAGSPGRSLHRNKFGG